MVETEFKLNHLTDANWHAKHKIISNIWLSPQAIPQHLDERDC